MDVRTLISDEGKFTQVFLAVPQRGYIDIPNHQVPLIAAALAEDRWFWGKIHNTHWRFFKYGVECEWDDLTNEQRWEVRTKTAWDGQVRDYWVELGYKDSRYYILEALCD